VAKVTDERLPRLPRDHVGVRKSIARVLTVHTHNKVRGLRKAAAGSKYMPARFAHEVRPAKRRALTKTELATSKTHKQRRKEAALPLFGSQPA
jgi:hypothetical protein